MSELRPRYHPIDGWMVGPTHCYLYRFPNDMGAVVTDGAVAGLGGYIHTLKLVRFYGDEKDAWEPLDFLHTHICEEQVHRLLHQIEMGHVTAEEKP